MTTVTTEDEPPVTMDVPSAQGFLYLNAAHRWLDRELGHTKEPGWLIKTVVANQELITFAQSRYVKGVYHNTTLLDWKRAYFDVDYVPGEGEDESHWPTQAIEITPSTSERTIRILAAWYSPKIETVEDISFWTVQHPDILMRALQMQAELDMRNSQGVRDIAEPLLHDVRQIYNDMIAEEMGGPTEHWRMD